MAVASVPLDPVGGVNHIGIDFLSPKSPGGKIEVRDVDDGTGFLNFDPASGAIEVGVINGLVDGAGITIDGLHIQDGQITGLRLNQEVQAYSPELTAIAGFSSPADGGVMVGNGSTFVLEAGATLRTSLGLNSPSGTDLADLAALSPDNSFCIVGNGTSWSTTLIGDLAAKDNINNSDWSGTDLSVSNGGTGRGSLTDNYLLVGNGTSAVSMVSPGASGSILRSNGTGSLPSFVTPESLDIVTESAGACSQITSLTNLATLGDGSFSLVVDDATNSLRPPSAGGANLGSNAEPFNGISGITFNFVTSLTTAGASAGYIPILINGSAYKLQVFNT